MSTAGMFDRTSTCGDNTIQAEQQTLQHSYQDRTLQVVRVVEDRQAEDLPPEERDGPSELPKCQLTSIDWFLYLPDVVPHRIWSIHTVCLFSRKADPT